MTENVRALEPNVNAETEPLAKLLRWYEAKAERGEVPANTARLRTTAVKQLVSVLGDDEPRDLRWLLDNVSDLATRWGTLNPGSKSDTIRTYASRSKKALEDYLSWAASPATFRFKRRDPERQPSDARTEAKKGTDQTSRAPQPSAPAPADVRDFPMGNNTRLTFTLPVDGLNVRDALRFSCHLLTLCKDFDPTAPTQASFFALARKET